MSRRAFALVVVVALHAAFGWVLFAPKPVEPLERVAPRPGERDEAPPRAATRPAETRSSRPGTARAEARYEAGEATARFASAAERLAYERGTAYELARQEALQRHHERTFGPDIGRLMRRPLREAWPALEQRALAGEDGAAHALDLLASCDVAIEERGSTYRSLRESAVEGLSPVDAAFVHGALDTELLALEADARTCRAEGFGSQRLADLAQRRLAALGRPEAPPTGDDRHAWRPYFERAFGTPVGPDSSIPVSPQAAPWIERLERTLTAEQWRALDRDPPDDATLVTRVAYCAMARCAELPAEAWDQADRYVQRAAEYGFPQAVSGVAERESGAGAYAQAHAWIEFGMWVIEAGCFPIAQSLEYAQLARQRAAIAARLTAAQFAEARRLFAALIRQHGNEALAAQGCTP